MYIKPWINKCAYSMVEMLIAMSVFSICALTLCSLNLFSVKGFSALANYGEMDHRSRQTVDAVTTELRQAREIVDRHPNSLTFINGDGATVDYIFSPEDRKLLRACNGEQTTLVDSCNFVEFGLFQRNPIHGGYDIYPVATNNWRQTVKVVNLTWKTSRTNLNMVNSENIQTARVVIRKQRNVQ